jgi:hypothetical protein
MHDVNGISGLPPDSTQTETMLRIALQLVAQFTSVDVTYFNSAAQCLAQLLMRGARGAWPMIAAYAAARARRVGAATRVSAAMTASVAR